MTRLMGNRKENYAPKDEYYTPKVIFDQMNIVFDLDVAAPKGGVTNVTAKYHFDKEMDGLSQKWFGNIWMNPPFSQATPWVNKFMEHGYGVALLPTSKAAWFSKIWKSADAVTLLNRVKFQYEGVQEKQIFMPCMLFAYGKLNVEGLKRLEDARVR